MPCGYTDQEWKKMGVKSVSEIGPKELKNLNGSKEDIQAAEESNKAIKEEAKNVVEKQQAHAKRPRAKKK